METKKEYDQRTLERRKIVTVTEKECTPAEYRNYVRERDMDNE